MNCNDIDKPLYAGGTGATAYSDAIGVYLAFLVSQVANHSSTMCGWNSANARPAKSAGQHSNQSSPHVTVHDSGHFRSSPLHDAAAAFYSKYTFFAPWE